MFTTALEDIKSILAEFWMKEIEMKAEEFGSDEPCYFFYELGYWEEKVKK